MTSHFSRSANLAGRLADGNGRLRALATIAFLGFLLACAHPADARIRLTGVAGTDLAGVASGEDGIWFSSFTHRDWQPAAGAGDGRNYTAALATSTDFFVVVADDGTVWQSTTALATSFVQRSQLGGALRDLIEVSSQLLVVGDGGYVGRSSDLSGGSWTPVASNTTRDLLAVASNRTSSTVAVGEGGLVIRGGLNGSNWQTLSIGETRALRALVVDTNGRYLAVGDDGAAWISDVAGLEWTAVDLGTDASLRGASRVGTAVVVVGEGQTILYSPGNFSAWQVQTAPSVDGAGSYDLLAVDGTGTPDWIAVGTGRVTLWSALGFTWNAGEVTPVIRESWGRIKGRFAP